MENYKELLEALMISNKNVRFSAICTLQGEMLFQKRREDIKSLFTLDETKSQLEKTIDSWKSRGDIKDKIGKPLYSITSYEKIKRITIPIDEEYLLFISMDNNDKESEKFSKITIKNISALLENDPTKS
ncbi:MAG: hypothetical protein HOK63_05640 [Thaumarchaeota archaeon]|jgi:hypothetical protein|nr:hypothetical protein [Nitrososphaerota archaeon]MBT6469114.1 hypothetical protein [Nitrososphaerota archaeon]